MNGRKTKTGCAVNATHNSIPKPSTKRQRVTADNIQKALRNSQVAEASLNHTNTRTKNLSMKTRAKEFEVGRCSTNKVAEDSNIITTKYHNLEDEVSKSVEPLSSVKDAEEYKWDRLVEYWKSIELPCFKKVTVPSLEELGYDDEALDEYFKNHLY